MDFEDFKKTILEIKEIFKHIPENDIRDVLKKYISLRRTYTREDLIMFVKANVDLHNF